MQSSTPSNVGLKRKLWVHAKCTRKKSRVIPDSEHAHATQTHWRSVNKSETNRPQWARWKGWLSWHTEQSNSNRRCEWRQVLNQSDAHTFAQRARECVTPRYSLCVQSAGSALLQSVNKANARKARHGGTQKCCRNTDFSLTVHILWQFVEIGVAVSVNLLTGPLWRLSDYKRQWCVEVFWMKLIMLME